MGEKAIEESNYAAAAAAISSVTAPKSGGAMQATESEHGGGVGVEFAGSGSTDGTVRTESQDACESNVAMLNAVMDRRTFGQSQRLQLSLSTLETPIFDLQKSDALEQVRYERQQQPSLCTQSRIGKTNHRLSAQTFPHKHHSKSEHPVTFLDTKASSCLGSVFGWKRSK